MMFIVLLALINLVTFALLLYSNDLPAISGRYSFNYKMPSVYDLDRETDFFVIDKYIKTVICPANEYFQLCDRYFSNDNSLQVLLSFFIFQFAGFGFLARSVVYSLMSYGYENKLTLILTVCILASFFLLAYWLIYKIYTAKFSVKKFTDTYADLKEQYKYEYEYFPISEHAGLQNFAISTHYSYLKSVQDIADRKMMVAKALYVVAGAIYIVFFFRGPE